MAQVDVECVVNEAFRDKMTEMRRFAGRQTSELQCPLMRMLQIEELLGRHVSKESLAG